MDINGGLVSGHRPLQPLLDNLTPIPACTAPVNIPEITSSQRHIKRPMNAFILWSHRKRRRISLSNAKISNSELSKQLGAEWRLMSESEKHPFIEEAKKIRQQHKMEYPNYKFNPRKKRKVRPVCSWGSSSSDLRTGRSNTPVNINSASFTYHPFSYADSAQTFGRSLGGFFSSYMPSTFVELPTPSLSSVVDQFGDQQERFANIWSLLGYTAAPVSNFYPAGVPLFPSNLIRDGSEQGSVDMNLAGINSALYPLQDKT